MVWGCIIASIKRERLRHLLNIPERYKILLVLALGKPAEQVVLETVGDDGDTATGAMRTKCIMFPKEALKSLSLKPGISPCSAPVPVPAVFIFTIKCQENTSEKLRFPWPKRKRFQMSNKQSSIEVNVLLPEGKVKPLAGGRSLLEISEEVDLLPFSYCSGFG